MFREFNVKFEDVEMLGGADNLLEGTEITKVIVRGDNNKMSSLDSMLKNCNELDTIDGELDLNGVSDIDNLLEGTELVKSINLKNINNENITANNSFPHVDQINIGGELYNKKAMQNVIASKEWTFDNINYQGTVGDNVVTKEININDNNKVTIQDALEQKSRGFEITGQTYENLVVGNGEVTLIDELTLESIDGSPNEFNPHIEQPVCVEVIEGNTVQDESNIYSIGELQENGTYKIDILTNSGKHNLFDINNLTVNGGDYISNIFIEVNEGDIYSSFNDSKNGWMKFITYNSDKAQVHSALGNIQSDSCTITVPKGIKYIKPVFSALARGGAMTVKGTTRWDYIPYTPYYETKQSILLPQPLNKIGDIKDKFYWDEDKGHYCIEQNFKTKVINNVPYYNYNECIDVDNCIKFSLFNNIIEYESATVGYVRYEITSNHFVKGLNWTNIPNSIYLHNSPSYGQGKGLILIVSKDKLKEYSFDGLNELLSRQPLEIIYQSKLNPNIIDLPHLNKKYSLDTYMPSTYIECVDTPLQPSKLLLESDIVRYKPSALETNTDYTVQFECKEKSNKKIKLNLGGSEKEVDAIVGLNHVSITTPNEIDTSLYKDRLFLSGVGNKVDNVMLVEGEMNQYPEYFDGVKSVGELQGDGSYKLDIISGNDFQNINLWDGKKVSDYKTDYIEIYDNTFSTNAYDMRVTEYDENYNIVTNEYITGSSNKILTTKSDKCKYIVINSNIFKPTDAHYVKEGLLVLSNRLVKFKEKPTGFKNILINSISLNSPLAKDDRLYWNKSNKRYEIDRSGSIEIPTVDGDVIDLPRLHQREGTCLSVETGNIKPSEIKIEYLDIN